MKAKVVRQNQATLFFDGCEMCRKYVETDKILFGSSTLLPGQRGAIDPGHPISNEVFYVSSGKVVMHTLDDDVYYELFAGDAILIPEGKPHELINMGTEQTVVTWACAPNPELKE